MNYPEQPDHDEDITNEIDDDYVKPAEKKKIIVD